MNLKTALLAGLGAMFIAAPAAVQAQDDSYYNDNGYYSDNADSAYHHHRHVYHRADERRGCHLGKRPRYGVFGQLHNRLTIVCN